MMQSPSGLEAVALLLDKWQQPMYVIDANRHIVYGNPALLEWVQLPAEELVGRLVEYHSEPPATSAAARTASPSPLTGLCPPPAVLPGGELAGTVSTIGRDRRLVHRRGRFLPLRTANATDTNGATEEGVAVLVILDASDLSPKELSQHLASEPMSDALHVAIRRFRRAQARHYTPESILGNSSAIAKVRAQVHAASSSKANLLISGRAGSGRRHVAKAVHYLASKESELPLVPLDGAGANEDLLRRCWHDLRDPSGTRHRGTLLVTHAHQLPEPLQSFLVTTVRAAEHEVRVIATVTDDSVPTSTQLQSEQPSGLIAELHDLVETIAIRMPRLVDRLEDLPMLAQYFVEACNRDSARQVGGLDAGALDQLALYSWPGELTELREVINDAYARCQSATITATDLPAVIHHAVHAAALPKKSRETIVLDEFLADVEQELIRRALAEAGGNKAEAARLLGLTRPRLYRRLEQLGLEEPNDAGDT